MTGLWMKVAYSNDLTHSLQYVSNHLASEAINPSLLLLVQRSEPLGCDISVQR